MELMVLVSKQQKVTTKYKMQATLHFSLICQSGEDIIIQNAGQVGFAAGQVGFQFTCLAGRVAEACIFDACEVSSTYQLHVIFQCICQHYIYNNLGLTCFLKHNQNSYKSWPDLDTLIIFFMFAVIFKPSHHICLNNFT